MGECKTTLHDIRCAADICRAHGWGIGTCLAGDESYGITTIRITAIGEHRILARALTHDGKYVYRSEGTWDLSHRDWREVTDPLAPSPAPRGEETV